MNPLYVRDQLPRRSALTHSRLRKAARPSFESLEGRLMMAGDGPAYQLAPAIFAGPTQAMPLDAAGTAVTPDGSVVVITKPPGNPSLFGYVFAGTPFSVTATLEDQEGQVLEGFDGSVTVALAANPSGGVLTGTLTVTASGGVAVFSGLTISQAGAGYTLQISAGSAGTTTTPFDVQANEILQIPESPAGPIVLAAPIVKKRGALTAIKLQFSQPMDPIAVTNLHNFALFEAGPARVFGNRGDRRLRWKSATYDAVTNMVTLTPAKPESLRNSLSLILNLQPPTGIQNATGQFLGGFRDYAPEVNEMLFLGKRPRKVKDSFLEGNAANLARLATLAPPWSARLDSSLPIGVVVDPDFDPTTRSLEFTPRFFTLRLED